MFGGKENDGPGSRKLLFLFLPRLSAGCWTATKLIEKMDGRMDGRKKLRNAKKYKHAFLYLTKHDLDMIKGQYFKRKYNNKKSLDYRYSCVLVAAVHASIQHPPAVSAI